MSHGIKKKWLQSQAEIPSHTEIPIVSVQATGDHFLHQEHGGVRTEGGSEGSNMGQSPGHKTSMAVVRVLTKIGMFEHFSGLRWL